MRRALLPLALVLLPAVPAAAGPLPPDQQVVVGRLPCAQPYEGRERGLRQLSWELTKRTSLQLALDSTLVDAASPELYRTPLVLWACEGPVAPLAEPARANLRRFLQLGGLLWVDDPSAAPGGPFDLSVRAELAALLPDRPLEPLARDHVLYKTFFLVERPVGRIAGGELLGLTAGTHLAVVYTAGDLLGALGRDLFGSWERAVEPGGEEQREQALRLAINVVFYALCLDYKNDRVHLPFILKRRRQ
ncbi:MAG TPA: DUF4159 domain-containing protein [Myxococcota bacterium]|nr:DUF4159 domain-containing protein [Myxococcota bacterium]HRY96848.1 DUF4159 domain-containing protein [Myxococcota bacterium]HSA23654.1 DUF4159 domain-containing protein [Myxococcota bacterium]